MSNDINDNKAQSTDKSKVEMPDLDECMARLRAVSRMPKNSTALAWLGLPAATYGNWKRRRVNYGALAAKLLERGISLDWFFAPDADLRYPAPDELPQVGEPDHAYAAMSRDAKVIKAIALVDAKLAEQNVPTTEANRELMVETYFTARRHFIPVPTALTQVAKALAMAKK